MWKHFVFAVVLYCVAVPAFAADVLMCDSGGWVREIEQARLVLDDTPADPASDEAQRIRDNAEKTLEALIELGTDPSIPVIRAAVDTIEATPGLHCLGLTWTQSWGGGVGSEEVCDSKVNSDQMASAVCVVILGLPSDDIAGARIDRDRSYSKVICFHPQVNVVTVAKCAP